MPDDRHDLDALLTRKIPFLDLLKVEVQSCARGEATIGLTVEDRHLRNLGILHGGVSACLLDSAIGLAAGTLARSSQLVVTAQLNVNFIRPAWKGETLTVRGTIQHAGQQTAVGRGEVLTSDSQLVSTGTATMMFIPGTNGREFPRLEDNEPKS